MKLDVKNVLNVSLIALSLTAIVALFWFAASYSRSVVPQRSFSVSGEGKVIAVPDVAEFSFTVITQGGLDVGALQSENAKQVNAANDYLKENRVDEKDIKTVGYSISPRYQRFGCEIGPCPPPEIVGYSINQTVAVKIRDFSRIGEFLSGVVKHGANSVSGLSFKIDDLSELRGKARDLATDEAREKAKAIAKSAGFRLGKILSISESFSSPPFYPVFLEERAIGDAAAVTPSIEPGSEEIQVNVSIQYEIK